MCFQINSLTKAQNVNAQRKRSVETYGDIVFTGAAWNDPFTLL